MTRPRRVQMRRVKGWVRGAEMRVFAAGKRVHGPVTRASAHATDEWLDEPISDAEKQVLIIEAVQDEVRAKLGVLRALISPDESVMLDVDQTVFGVIAEVLCRIGGTPSVLGPMGLTYANLYDVGMAAAFAWAGENDEEARIVRGSPGSKHAAPGQPKSQGTLFDDFR